MLKFDQATHMWSLSWAQDKDLVRSPYLCDELCSFPCFQICHLVLQVSKPRFDATRLSKIHTCAKMKMFKGYVYCIDLYRVFEVDLAVYDSMINFDSLPFSWRSQAVASLNLTLRKEADVKRKRKKRHRYWDGPAEPHHIALPSMRSICRRVPSIPSRVRWTSWEYFASLEGQA